MAQQIVLQQPGILGRKLEFDVAADSCIDSVEPLAFREQRIQSRPAFLNPLASRWRECSRSGFTRNGAEILDFQRTRADQDCSGHALMLTLESGKNDRAALGSV